MSVATRKTHRFRKRLFWHFLYLLFLALVILFYYLFNFFSRPLFITPLVKGGSLDSLDVEKKLKDAKIPFVSINSDSNSSYIITIALGGEIRMSSRKNIDKQISSLQRILRELTIEGRPFKSIDLRFEKPVVEFN